MGFVAIRVHGKTFPHRRNLIDDYGLEYDFRKRLQRSVFGIKQTGEQTQRIL